MHMLELLKNFLPTGGHNQVCRALESPYLGLGIDKSLFLFTTAGFSAVRLCTRKPKEKENPKQETTESRGLAFLAHTSSGAAEQSSQGSCSLGSPGSSSLPGGNWPFLETSLHTSQGTWQGALQTQNLVPASVLVLNVLIFLPPSFAGLFHTASPCLHFACWFLSV